MKDIGLGFYCMSAIIICLIVIAALFGTDVPILIFILGLCTGILICAVVGLIIIEKQDKHNKTDEEHENDK